MSASAASLRGPASELSAQRPPRSQSAYRPDIDGLRAVAVLPVLAFHAFPEWVPGGFVGVDIFFVISGFLISSIILNQLAAGTFSYVAFYARRIKRIFPALLLVLVCVWLVGFRIALPDEFRQLGKHIAAGSGFISNFAFRAEPGYFDGTSEDKPLLHLWSLAIEEQFYIAWPLLLAFLPKRWVARGAIPAIAVASLAFNVSIAERERVLDFYSPLSRFWELMVGGMLAQLAIAHPERLEGFCNLRAWIGIALIAGAIGALDSSVPYPGWYALLPTLGAFLLISAGPEATVNRAILGNRFAVWVGSISYPLYLWHWPLLAFAHLANDGVPEPGVRVALLVASFALAWATARWVEGPIRHSRDMRSLPVMLLLGLGVVGVVGYGTLLDDGLSARFGDAGKFMASFENARPEMKFSASNGSFRQFREECNFYDLDAWRAGHATDQARAAIDPSCTTPPAGARQSIFLWGDSHAEHLNGGLRRALPKDVAVLQVASSGCPAELVEPDAKPTTYCGVSNQVALETIRREKPAVVVIAQRERHQAARFREIAAEVRKAGVKTVLVLGPIPQWKPDLHKIVGTDYWDATPRRLRTDLDEGTLDTERKLKREIARDEPFAYLDLFDALCTDEGCLTYVGNDRKAGLMAFDYGHLTPRASNFVGRYVLAPVILQLLKKPRTGVLRAPRLPIG